MGILQTGQTFGHVSAVFSEQTISVDHKILTSEVNQLDYDLICDAFNQNDEVAWTFICAQYRSMVCSWILRLAPGCGDADLNRLVNETYFRFWQSISGKSKPVNECFSSLSCLLKYLKCCARSAVQSEQRRYQRQTALVTRLEGQARLNPDLGRSSSMLESLERKQLCSRLRQWVDENIVDELERTVIKLSFECDFTPSEIAATHPDAFENAKMVRRIKERVLRRAKRNFHV